MKHRASRVFATDDEREEEATGEPIETADPSGELPGPDRDSGHTTTSPETPVVHRATATTQPPQQESLQRSGVTVETRPDRAALAARYDMAVEPAAVTRLHRLEAEYGQDRVSEWADEGIPVRAMGKPHDMAAYRSGNDETEQTVPDNSREPSVAGRVQRAISSPGGRLDEPIQREMEALLGEDFSDVTIHTGGPAATAADHLDAKAFTVGNHVVFNRDRYEPTTTDGKALLAHELTHVRQQDERGVRPQPCGQLTIDPDPRCEREAERTASAVQAGEQSQGGQVSPAHGIQREGTDESAEDDVETATEPFLEEATDEPDWAPGPVPADEHDVDIDPEDGLEMAFQAFMASSEGQRLEAELQAVQAAGEERLRVFLQEQLVGDDHLAEAFEEKSLEEFEAYREEEGEKSLGELTELLLERNWVRASIAGGVIGGLLGLYATDTEIPDDAIDMAKEHIDLRVEAGNLTLEFDPEYSGVPFDPDEWGGTLEATYALEDEHEFGAELDYEAISSGDEVADTLGFETGVSGPAGGVSIEGTLENLRETVSFADLELGGEMEHDVADSDLSVGVGLGAGFGTQTVDEDEYEELVGEPPTPDAPLVDARGQPTDEMPDDFEREILTQTGTLEVELGADPDDATSWNVGASVTPSLIEMEPALETQLQGALETTRELKAQAALMLETGPTGTRFASNLEMSYELLDGLETTLTHQYENAMDGTIDWELQHKAQYELDAIQFQLLTKMSADERRVMFGVGGSF